MKRFFDFSISLIAFAALTPILICLAILVRFKLGSPVLFKQMRPGLYGKPFMMYKFRSMTDARDAKGCLLPDVDRFNRFSSFLRKSSLDELPELVNVLKGDMSLVGPRPLLIQYLKRYTAEQARRHNVKPGITGWAQVNGRNAISWDDKFDLDIYYVENISFILDLKIFIKTIKKVFLSSDINKRGEATMHRFKGSNHL